MQIIITGRHFEVTELIRKNTSEKIEALLEYYPTLKVSSVRVTMEIEKNHQAKVGIWAAVKKLQIIAEGNGLDLYKAIDAAIERVKTQLDRYVDKYKRPEPTPPTREISQPEAVLEA